MSSDNFDHKDDRGEFREKKKKTIFSIFKIIGILLFLSVAVFSLYLIWFQNETPKDVKQKKKTITISDKVPDFKIPEIEKPKKEIIEKPIKEDETKDIKEEKKESNIHLIPPKKENLELQRKLKSGLTYEAKKKDNLNSNKGVNIASTQKNGLVDNIDYSVTKTEIVTADQLPSLKWIIPKGTPISCVLETAIQSDQPGLIKCTITEDIYSTDSTIKLIDRGSVATGEYRVNTISYGKSRIFAIWDRIRTPQGVVINIASPATDNLGRAGIGGYIDNHYFERFGAAILISIIDDIFDNNNDVNRNNYDDTHDTLNDSINQILVEYSRIRPTLHTHQGAMVLIFTARDLDMSTVYSLENNTALQGW